MRIHYKKGMYEIVLENGEKRSLPLTTQQAKVMMDMVFLKAFPINSVQWLEEESK